MVMCGAAVASLVFEMGLASALPATTSIASSAQTVSFFIFTSVGLPGSTQNVSGK